MNSPTQRSLALLRKEGYVCQVVEHYNQFSMRRVDLFGFIDIVCLGGANRGILAIQTTSASNLSARIKKITELGIHKLWLACGGRIECHGWSKKGKKGKFKHWQVRRIVIK